MNYSLHNLKRPSGLKKKGKRVGRGNSSGKGTYSGKGIKGQLSRSGGRRGTNRRNAFEQFFIRTPKLRGFKRSSRALQTINLGDLEDNFKEGDVVDLKSMLKAGLTSSRTGGIKVLGNGKIKKKLHVKARSFSKAAKTAIEKAGGTCETV